MPETITVSIPKTFIENTLQSVMQLKGDLNIEDKITIIDWLINDSTGELDLLISKEKEVIN